MDIEKINVGGTEYDVCDSVARESLDSLNDKTIGYFITRNVSGANTLEFNSRFTEIGSGSRQSVFIFGCVNNDMIYGILMVRNTGVCEWSGIGSVSASMGSTGIVTVTLPSIAYDRIALLSPESIS